MAISNIIGGTNIGSGTTGSTGSISVVKETSPTQREYDIKPQGYGYNSFNTINLDGFSFYVHYVVRDPNATLPAYYIHKIKIYVGGILYTEIDLGIGWLLRPREYLTFELPRDSSKHNVISFENDNAYDIDVEIFLTNGDSYRKNKIDTISVVDTYVKNISISSSSINKKTFWQNDKFVYVGLILNSDKYFKLAETFYKTEQVSSYYISTPDMSVPGRKEITVGYYDLTTSYFIDVYGVSSFTLFNPSKTYFRNGEELTGTPSAEICWDNATKTIVSSDYITWLGFDISKKGVQTITGSYYDTTTKTTQTASYQINVCPIETLDISGTFKTQYYTNEELDFSGLSLTASYGSALPKNISIQNVTIIKPDMATSGSKYVTLSYTEDGKTVSDSYSINVIGLEEITVDTSKQNLSFLTNSTISLSDIKVYAKIGSETRELAKNEYTIDYTKINKTTAGKEQEINVEIYALSHITLYGGVRTYYVINGVLPKLNLQGLSVQATYTNNTAKIFHTYIATPQNGTELSLGDTRVVISFTDGGITKTANFNVTTIDDYPIEITSVEISEDTKTVYSEGETFSKSGIIVKAKMQSGRENVSVSFTTNLDGVKITENETLIVYVGSLTKETNIEILCDKLENVSIITLPTKTRYKIGESLDLTGLVVQAYFTVNGYKTLNRNEYSCSFSGIFTANDVGQKTIVITYNDKQSSFNISVVKLASISVSHDQTKTYVRNNILDKSFITASKTYSDGASETISADSLTYNPPKLVPDVNSTFATITANYTEQGITATTTFQVKVKALSKIELSDGVNIISKIYLYYSNVISLADYYILKTFNDGSTEQTKIDSSVSFKGKGDLITSKVESFISFTYGGETKSCSFVFHCYSLKDIEIISNPTKTVYFENETLNLSGLKVNEIITCTDETISDSTNEVDTFETNLNTGHALSLSDTNLIVSYTKYEITKSKTIQLTINEIAVSELSVAGEVKLYYVERQSIDISNLIVTAIYNNGSTKVLNATDYTLYIDGEIVSKTLTFTEKYNNKTLSISYQNVTKELGTIVVEKDTILSIEIFSTTQKTTFYIGDKFSTDKLGIKVNYVSGYTEEKYEGFITDYDQYKNISFSSSDVGTKIVSVYYQDKVATYEIKIDVPTITEVTLDTSAILLTPTNGTAYSLNNLLVKLKFHNGFVANTAVWTSDVETVLNMTDGIINCTNNLGKKEISIVATNPYNENDKATTILIIDVMPNKQLKSITLKYTSDDYDTYRIGEKFTAKGIALRAEFVDADPVENITNFTTSPEIGTVLRSGGRKTITIYYSYLGVELSEQYTINVLMSFESGAVKTTTYKPVFNVSEYVYEEATLNKETLGFDLVLLYPDILVKVDTTEESPTYGKNILTDLSKKDSCIGYLDLGKASDFDNSTIKNAHVIFFEDITNPVSGDGNIVVKFPRYVEGQADKINKCKFGVLYNKRLFVSGNEEHKNFDWHSSQITAAQLENYTQDSNKDFTYFSDLDYCKYGSEESAVVGYDIYRDGNLLVIKSGSRNEATLYTRKLEYTNAMSYDGGVIGSGSYVEESYPCFDINKNGGVGGISDRSIVNFNGDSLVMTPAGLKLIASSSQVYDNSKYTYDVSNKINNKLLKEDIANTHTFVFKDKIFIKTSRGVYVGEYALRNNDTKEYEWYFIDNVNNDLFFEYNNELYFANDNGEICVFNNEDYFDKDRLYINQGGITLSNGEIFISNKYRDFVKNGNSIHLLESENEIHASLSNFINENKRNNVIEDGIFNPLDYNGVIDPTKNVIRIEPYDENNEIDWEKFGKVKDLYYSGKEVYFDNISQSGTKLQPKNKHFLKQVENDNPLIVEFEIYNQNNKLVDLKEINELRMSYKVSELSYCKIDGVSEQINESLSFYITGDNQERLDLINYNGYVGAYSAVITNKKAVKAFYITKPLDMGSVITNKTIWAWFIVNDTDLASEVDVGYYCNRRQGDFNLVIDTTTGSRQLDFSKLVWNQLQWTSDKLPRIHPTYKTVPNIGFIRFVFKNEEPTNMVLTKLSLIYTLNNLIGGIK